MVPALLRMLHGGFIPVNARPTIRDLAVQAMGGPRVEMYLNSLDIADQTDTTAPEVPVQDANEGFDENEVADNLGLL